ncbi:hypothetical protein HPULCUR_001458 [Helicostylum pulchrum]|uniref:Uncharacterized protein n=1 Tax=Helicostylum pulchrum TaxID=562976 RepID=A0ABP9XMS6_9FUNG
MNIAETVEITLIWFDVSLAASVLTFLVTAFYVYKYRSTKAAIIAGSASLSTLASLISDAIYISAMLTRDVQLSVSNVLLGVELAFAFFAIFYAFHCIIPKAVQGRKLVVYVGYVWMVVTVAIGIAVSVLMSNDIYNYTNEISDSTLHLILSLPYSIWGFIAVTLLLFFMNLKDLNLKTGYTMSVFIILHLISAVITTIMVYSDFYNTMVPNAIIFFFSYLLLRIAAILAVYYGSTWIQDNNNYVVSNTESEDLEANQPANP